MSVLENNCMQSTASAAGYSTGSTIATMFGALLLLTDIPGKASAEIRSWDIQPVWVVAVFTMCTGLMGVFLAIPMKRQMINYEGLRFPSGVAAAETLRNLHAESKEAVLRAYVLLGGIFIGLIVGILNTAEETLDFLDRFNNRVAYHLGFALRVPESLPELGFFRIAGKQLISFQFDLSVLLIAAGVITRMRVCLSMFVGSMLLYCVVGPQLLKVDMHSPGSGWVHHPEGVWIVVKPAVEAQPAVAPLPAVKAQPATPDHPAVEARDAVDARPAVKAEPAVREKVEWVYDARLRDEKYLTNIPLNVKPPDLSAATVAKAVAEGQGAKFQGPVIREDGTVVAAFGGTTLRMTTWALWGGTAVMVFASLTALGLQWKTVVRAFSGAGRGAKGAARTGAAADVEVPTSWMVMGMIPIGLAMLAVQIVGFHISWWAGAIAIALSFFLVIVACRATGETDTTPIGAMGKVMQLLFAVLHPGDIRANLASAGIAANSASSSADLLTDLKSGYLLGANPRKQFIAQFVGVFFGTVAVVPIWFLMVPDKAHLEKFAAPATRQWEAVARVLTKGIDQLPHSAQIAILGGAALGILLPILEKLFPKHRQFLPSAMGLGLSWVIPFSSSAGFLVGAILGWLWETTHRKSADKYSVGLASGLIAGEGLMKALVAMTATALGLLAAK
jgi:uncharacterized oligopeptide transporter (OPT) family protein